MELVVIGVAVAGFFLGKKIAAEDKTNRPLK